MLILRDARRATEWAERTRAAGLSIGLVPTMGALHAGHFALVEAARRECDRVAVTVFVNPTQFGPGEDLSRYPRTPEEDAAGCRERGADLCFLAETSGPGGVYEDDHDTWVSAGGLSGPLCGRSRPGHFRGVATVVAILFGIFRPHRAYFGRKDFQQARIIERMALDLRSGVGVRLIETVREPDGLALSSRNRYLDAGARERALALPRALEAAAAAWRGGEARPSALQALVRAALERAEGVDLEYAEALDARSLRPVEGDRVDAAPDGVVIAAAVRAGGVRLIDNVLLGGAGARETLA